MTAPTAPFLYPWAGKSLGIPPLSTSCPSSPFANTYIFSPCPNTTLADAACWYPANPIIMPQSGRIERTKAILDPYLSAGHIQHSISPWPIPPICVTAIYQKLNKTNEIVQITIPRVDELLDALEGGSVSSIFDLFSGFTYSTIGPEKHTHVSRRRYRQ